MNRFVVFDVEMPCQQKMRISAIGITVIEDGKICDKRFYYVNPQCRFDPYVIKLIGITPEMVEDKPTFPEIWEEIKDIMSSGILVAHGAPGDMKVLCECLKYYEIEWKETAQYLCTCEIGLECYPYLDGHSLDVMCKHIGFDLDHHNAQSDSEGCARLLLDYIKCGADLSKFLCSFDCIACQKIRDKVPPKKRFENKVRKKLFSYADEQSRLQAVKKNPNIDSEKIIGIKSSKLRSLAKYLVKNNKSDDFMRILPHKYLEENHLHALLLSRKKKFSSCVSLLDKFLPYIDSDETCEYLKPRVFKAKQTELPEHLCRWLTSDIPYAVSFAVSVITDSFFTEEYIEHWLVIISQCEVASDFINKKRALLLSNALFEFEEQTLPYFEHMLFNKKIHNDALFKIVSTKTLSPQKKKKYQSLQR